MPTTAVFGPWLLTWLLTRANPGSIPISSVASRPTRASVPRSLAVITSLRSGVSRGLIVWFSEASTVTEAVAVSGCMRISLNPTRSPGRSGNGCDCQVEKPGTSTRTWYLRPASIPGTENSPLPLLTVLRSELLSKFVTTTEAPRITAPVESFATPDTVPVVSCAKAGGCHNSRAAISNPKPASTGLNSGKRVIGTNPHRLPTLCARFGDKTDERSHRPRTIAPPRGREHAVANDTVPQQSMSSFGLRLCGLRAVKVKGFFLPVERKPYPGQNLLDNHNRWNENDPAFSAHLCARGVRGTRNRIVLRAGAMKAISGMALAGDLVCLRTGCGGSRGVVQERTAQHSVSPSWFSHFEPSPARHGGLGRSAQQTTVYT